MKAALAIALAAQIAVTALTLWLCSTFAGSMHEAATALTKASNDYRDSYMEYQAERVRIASMLEQFSKDATRMRSYLQRKGG